VVDGAGPQYEHPELRGVQTDVLLGLSNEGARVESMLTDRAADRTGVDSGL
jgi:hypothetical protein